jgi:Domain of unknown function (DUF4276)
VNGFTVVFSMSNINIGLITEDDTDWNAVREIIHRVLDSNVTIKKWTSGGSVPKTKLSRELKVLFNKGCSVFIVVQDLDRSLNGSLNDEETLRSELKPLFSVVNSFNNHICIPIEELEAWFWSDPNIIKDIGGGKGKAHPNPHQIKSPKEELRKLSIGKNGKPSYSTNRNAELAKKLDMDECSKRCPSFRKLVKFLRSL